MLIISELKLQVLTGFIYTCIKMGTRKTFLCLMLYSILLKFSYYFILLLHWLHSLLCGFTFLLGIDIFLYVEFEYAYNIDTFVVM